MLRILPLVSAALAACSPSPEDAVMHRSGTVPEIADRSSKGIEPEPHSGAPHAAGQDAGDSRHAAQGPILEAVSAAENPAPASPANALGDSPAEAEGRRTLSTAFVRIGPDGHLTVELRDGRTLVLRDVVMRARKYCGVPVPGGAPGSQYCGGYADIAAARPGGAPPAGQPKPTLPDPTELGDRPSGRQ